MSSYTKAEKALVRAYVAERHAKRNIRHIRIMATDVIATIDADPADVDKPHGVVHIGWINLLLRDAKMAIANYRKGE